MARRRKKGRKYNRGGVQPAPAAGSAVQYRLHIDPLIAARACAETVLLLQSIAVEKMLAREQAARAEAARRRQGGRHEPKV